MGHASLRTSPSISFRISHSGRPDPSQWPCECGIFLVIYICTNARLEFAQDYADVHGPIREEMQQCMFLPHEIMGSLYLSNKLHLATGLQEQIFPLLHQNLLPKLPITWFHVMAFCAARTWKSSGLLMLAPPGSNHIPSLAKLGCKKVLFLCVCVGCVCLCLGYHASVSWYMFLSLYVSLIKDQNANLSRIIPLRLYGDGCEATRALTRCVACREVLRIDFSVVNYANVWNWKS